MQHDAICNVELRRAIIRQSILYWALQALQCRGPTPERALTGDAWLDWEVKCKFKAQCKATEGTQK